MTKLCLFLTGRAGIAYRLVTSLWMLWLLLLAVLWPVLARAQDAECADVKIVIQQKVSLERQAFDAQMVIRNGLSDSLSNVSVELTYLDQNQQPVTATTDPNAVGAVFFQSLNQITGINAVDGSSSLPGQTTANIDWLIIPSQGAGGDTANGQLYYIGAKVTYTLDGQTTTVNVTPDYVVVRPQPLLVLDYFLPTDVYGDDPFTPQVEPPVPFTLGVRITNIGAGTSVATTIDSAQPQIVDNQQGLLINFQILGSYVGNQPAGKTLLLNFGDIPSQQSVVGRWIMQTTLSGQFTSFTASYSHADSLGGAVTSLIQGVNTYKLVHDVLIDLAGADDIPDFLAEAGSGVHVYDSQGGDSDVINVSGSANLASVGNGNLHLTFTPAPNLIWAKVSDPFKGAKSIVGVVRSDGKVLPAQNYWLSKTRNADLSWSYFIQIFDSNTTGDYVLEFSQDSATASLSGLAYLDANGNGVRDAGEAAESNLTVTLKGVDNQGSNVLATAYTDAGGNFSFAGLTPGTYQLQAASVNGLADGIWAAGSAGGVAQPGSITGITLAAGIAAQGYLIAKTVPAPVPPPNAATADLSITLQAAQAQLHGGQSTTVTALVRNAGPGSARAAVAQVAVPAGLTLQSSNASSGTYAGSAWSIGDLAAGQQATLTLTVQANPVSGSQNVAISWPASVTSATTDPQPANNSALLGLTVLADNTNTLELTQSLPAYADALMLLSCPDQIPADQPACQVQAATEAQTLLAAHLHRLTVVTDLAAWRTAARSGAYNLLWLHGGAGKLDIQQLQETRAAVRRGATLIVDGATAAEQAGVPMTDLLADVLGGHLALPALGSNQLVTLPNEPAAQGTAGPLYQIDALADDAYVMAQSASANMPVMVNHPFGLGKAWLAGFDLLQALNPASGSAAFWNDYLGQQIQALTPPGNASPALAGSQLTVQASAYNNAAAGDPAQAVNLDMDVPAGASYQNATPTPTQVQSQQVQWSLSLAPAASGTGQITLVLPQSSASLQLQSSLLDPASLQLLASQTLPIQVLGLDTLVPQVDAELVALSTSTSDAAAQSLIAQARSNAAAAEAAQAAQPPDWDAALTALADLQTTLTQLAQPPYNLSLDTLALDVARWIGLAQSSWQGPVTTPGSANATQVLSLSGGGQNAEVNSPFAAPLVAQALDAQNNPVPGITVHFQLPATGASAQFASGAQTVDVSTDAQGLATSPVLTANATAGSYQASASINGVTQTASFALTNQSADGGSLPPAPPVPATLRLISGTAQSAQIGTAFAAPIAVQVLDTASQPMPGVNVTITFAASGPSAAFPGNQRSITLSTDSQGMAISPVFTANGVLGAHQVSVTAADVSGALTVGLNNVAQTPALKLQLIQGDNQSAPVNQAYGLGFTVRVTDAQNNPKQGVTVLFSLPASGPSGSFGNGQITVSAVTGADGVALSPVPVANGVQGSYQALAAVENAAQPVLLHLTNLPPAGSGKQFTGTVAAGKGAMTAQITGGGDSCVFNPAATRLIPPNGIWTPGQSFQLPYGLFDFELVGCTPGSEVTISTTWPDLHGVTGYLKYGPTPASGGQSIWYALDNPRIQGNTITYTLRDGSLGDDDLSANGVIRDPGGPIIGSPPNSQQGPQPIPALSAWALALLAALLGLGAARRLRHRV